jgi:hypothetical protein
LAVDANAVSIGGNAEIRRTLMNRAATVETALGSLIAALTEETTRYVRDEYEVNRVVAFVLAHILRNSSNPAGRASYWQ